MNERFNTVTKRIRVYGIVQGVGFRPTVARHAKTAGICGRVINKGSYVEIIAQGSPEACAAFSELLKTKPPKRAYILKISEADLGTASVSCEKADKNTSASHIAPLFTDFVIAESEHTGGDIYISPDIAICDECKKELFDPTNRRYLHPFINCTNCGPRMTILDALPYDRERTSMKEFPMCPECSGEYHSHGNRRFDAQPVCCNECGPEVYVLDKSTGLPSESLRRGGAITFTRKIISDGGIAAVKGIGGFHLCCDASNEKAVSLLRGRKHRLSKPFAVMMRDLDTVKRECLLTSEEEEVLCGHRKPIVLLERAESGGAFRPLTAAGVAPGNPKLGVMLPYAPIQLLLFDYPDGIKMPDILVMTSANESGAPICRDDADAVRELSELADVILSNNRLIRVRADDTVTDFFGNKPYMIRRSRGYAPLPVLFSDSTEDEDETRSADAENSGISSGCGKSGLHSVIGIGGELKNSFCIGKGSLFYPSPYIGDLGDIRTVDALKETVARFLKLLETSPEAVACDMHPLYQSRRLAYELQSEWEHLINGNTGSTFGDKTDYSFDPEFPCEYSWADFRKDLRHDSREALREIGCGCLREAFYQEHGENASENSCKGLCEGAFPYSSSGACGSQNDKETVGYKEYTHDAGYTKNPCKEDFRARCTDKAAEACGGSEGRRHIRLFEIQHHYAHILSCMAENNCSSPVIGLSFDGTGYGTDKTIWGGEILISDLDGFLRAGHITPFIQAGGDISSREGWRIAAEMLSEIYGDDASAAEALGLCTAAEYRLIKTMAARGINSVVSTSAGRLFDAVSAVLGIKKTSSYEGEASCALMYAAQSYLKHNNDNADPAQSTQSAGKAAGGAVKYAAPDTESDELISYDRDSIIINTKAIFNYIVNEKLRGAESERLAYKFHVLLAEASSKACLKVSELTGIKTVALSGGVFQNTLLLSILCGMLKNRGMKVFTHSLIPPNDGGIGLGQAVFAMNRLNKA